MVKKVEAEEREASTLSARPSLASLADDALETNDNVVEVAAASLRARLDADQPLMRMVLDDMIRVAVSQAIYGRISAQRRAALARAGRPQPPALSREAVLGTRVADGLLDFPLWSGKRLRDATRAEVLQQARRYESIELDVARKRSWLEAIAARMGRSAATKTVGQVLSVATVERMYAEAADGGA